MALPAWCVELALQAIHGAIAGRPSDLLVCRYPRLRDGLSFIPAIWRAGSAGSDDLHGLDFEVADAPFFMEATPAVTAFAINATLLSAVVKPFGRPFKITDKGGDRSAPRVHWKLASVFGLISLSSAASIVWAFVSPYAAGEISSVDFFNLLWAGIAMLIAFIAFLVCFELPRGEALFAVDEAAQLALGDNVISGHVTGLSTSSARISFARNLPAPLSNQPVRLYLDALGWVEAEVSSRSKAVIGLRLRPTFAQHRQLVVTLFGTSSNNVDDHASLRGAIFGTISRGFRGK